ncbi:hypothetical protein [Mycobacterium gastri]|uniref:hypothetical protein n=1 Tax=Mycobacterium gastri TaxID=1777 RepID=UPI00111C15FD
MVPPSNGASSPVGSSVIDEPVREGARRMLAETLRAEVDAYIDPFSEVRDDNGHLSACRKCVQGKLSCTVKSWDLVYDVVV